MSYTFLLESGEESSAECFSDIPASVLLSLSPTAERCSSNDNTTESYPDSQSGTTCEPLMDARGADVLTPCVEASLAKTSASREVAQELKANAADSGVRWNEPLAKFDPVTCSWETRQCLLFEDSGESLEAWPQWGIMRNGECFHARMPVAFTYGKESGLRLPTPRSCTAMQARITENTAKAKFPNLETVLARLTIPTIGKNENKGSSTKRFIGSPDFRGAKMSEGLRICAEDPIYLNPLFAELVMMWPMGWTDLQPLEMDRFREWLSSHGKL